MTPTCQKNPNDRSAAGRALGRVKSSALVRVQRITTAAEARAERILRRTLMGTGWTVALKLPIQVVLNMETTR